MTKYVIMRIGFYDNVDDNQIEEMCSKFYADNENKIKGIIEICKGD